MKTKKFLILTGLLIIFANLSKAEDFDPETYKPINLPKGYLTAKKDWCFNVSEAVKLLELDYSFETCKSEIDLLYKFSDEYKFQINRYEILNSSFEHSLKLSEEIKKQKEQEVLEFKNLYLKELKTNELHFKIEMFLSGVLLGSIIYAILK